MRFPFHPISFVFFFVSVMLGQLAYSQTRWYNPLEQEENLIRGRLMNEKNYHRLPDAMQATVREPVWNLSKQSAGLYLDFQTDATEITVEYKGNVRVQLPHMPATGVSGLDLYVENAQGDLDWVRGAYSFGDTIRYIFRLKQAEVSNQNFRLFLPLYNGVDELRIGVGQQSEFGFLPVSDEPPIIIYGTSIAQGACASRPALAWTSILMRDLNQPVVNLGFSGNGLLEKELIEFIGSQDARLFILDCLPNMQPGKNMSEEEMRDRIQSSVKYLKEKHPDTPILLTYHAGLGDGLVDSERNEGTIFKNQLLQQEYESLLAQEVQGIYLLTMDEIGMNEGDFVDGTHPTDGGMKKYADAYALKIRQIFE